MARLLGAQVHVAAIAGDLGPDDMAALHLAALQAHDHRAAGDGLMFTGLEVAENEDVAGPKLDHLAVADIVHEFDVGGGAFHIFDQRGRDERCRSACRNLS